MKTKTTQFAVAIAIAISCSSVTVPAYAFLGMGGATDIAKESTQMARWILQYAQMYEQYTQLVKTYNSLNGTRGMASLVNNPALRHYLPADYENILGKGYGNWQPLRASIEDPIGNQKLYKNRRDQVAIDEAMALESYRQASRRFQDIQVLLDRVNAAPDAKDIADLQGRIQAEQVMLQNESVKLAMLKNLQEIQQRKMAEQASRNYMDSLSRPGALGAPRSAHEIFGNQP
ncbi:P-type DNA transfer protein VirB5 [Acidovorax sp. LjRoot129]|uniref:P-type DNA transfer protein VirB5 n=1 Tax=Acidovorax sp. LjRoot129 TaxID=3342260 RepID=UPI003ED0C0E6